LEDQNLREGIKIYSDWPTIPQLYIKKEFVGGCDIVKEMYENGELKDLLKNNNINFKE
jgi:monothiol glutaredoxin